MTLPYFASFCAAACARVPVLFFLALGTGLVTAIFTLSGLLSSLFKSHPVELWSLFFGLIDGSTVLLARMTWPWKFSHIATFIAATVGTYLLGVRESAGINRLGNENERVLQKNNQPLTLATRHPLGAVTLRV